MLWVFLKELKGYFTSAIGYIFMATFLLISGIFFAISNLLSSSSYYNSVFQNIMVVFLFIVPILTMKILSEETKTKTDQLLLTSPLKITDIVLGKYFAAVSVFLFSLLITVSYAIMLSRFTTLAKGEIFTGYVGIFLLGASLIAIGVFVSSLTENQISAAVITFGVLLFVWLIDSIKQGLPSGRTANIVFAGIIVIIVAFIVYSATKNIIVGLGTTLFGVAVIAVLYISKKEVFDGLIQNILGWFSLLNRYQLFSQGMLDLTSVVYYLSFCTAFLFLTIRMIEKRRWS